VGWYWVRQAARSHDVWVITRTNNRDEIEEALSREPLPRATFVWFDLPRWARWWKRGLRGIHLYYYLWQLGTAQLARDLHRRVRFDVAHHLTFGAYWLPSGLAFLSVPLVWGPVGGAEEIPRAFLAVLGPKGRAQESLRRLALVWGRLDPLVHLTFRHASIILAQTVTTTLRFPARHRQKAIVFPAVGFEGPLAEANTRRKPLAPFRVLSVGRLLPFKGFTLGLRAFALLVQLVPNCEYRIVGDGPERQRLQRLAVELGVADRVAFMGLVPRQRVLEEMQNAHVLLHPSLRDPPASVVTEAMACGVPVVCLDLGGPGMQVEDGTGIRVPARSPEQAVAGLARALQELATAPYLRERLGEAALRLVDEKYVWDAKRLSIDAIYEAASASSFNPKSPATPGPW
jgi:glycosyltransferase involved in cell wall biosynthesis